MTALPELIAAAVGAEPGVAGLDAGPYGTIASLLPGRRIDGVRIGATGAVEVAVRINGAGPPVPELAERLRTAVRELAGDVRVDVHVTDLELEDSP